MQNVFDQITVGRMYAEANAGEWYDLVTRLDDEKLKEICVFFHSEIILACQIKITRYNNLLSERYAILN